MNTAYYYLARFLGLLTSLKLAVWTLVLLMVIVFFGTTYQVDHGLHAAQEEFYYSWLTPPIGRWYTPEVPNALSRAIGWIPLAIPGGMTILWLLFINLFTSMMIHFQYGLRRSGIVLIHFGLLLMLAGGWVTHLTAEEGFLTLTEGDASNVASSYKQWEIAVWEGSRPMREVHAYDADALKTGDQLPFDQAGFSLLVHTYHPNVRAFRDPDIPDGASILNAASITRIDPAPGGKEPEALMPGARLTAQLADGSQRQIILFGGDPGPVMIESQGAQWFVMLRKRRIPLPVLVKLLDFRKEFEPNSTIPKSFSSLIDVTAHELEREVSVEMNRPFRYVGFTFFQASYADGNDGREVSTFAVTRNHGQLVPYIATGITVIGLIIHFLLEMVRPRRELKGGGA